MHNTFFSVNVKTYKSISLCINSLNLHVRNGSVIGLTVVYGETLRGVNMTLPLNPRLRDHIVNVRRDRLKPFRKFACKYIPVLFYVFFFLLLSCRNNPYLLRYLFIFYRYRISHSSFPLILSTLNTYTHHSHSLTCVCTVYTIFTPVPCNPKVIRYRRSAQNTTHGQFFY